jgi:hypothetical protein
MHRTSIAWNGGHRLQYDPSPVLIRKHWSEKTDSSISLTYQQMQQTERTVIRQLGEIPTNNRNRTVTNAQQTKEVAMKTSTFKFKFVASWAVALSEVHSTSVLDPMLLPCRP